MDEEDDGEPVMPESLKVQLRSLLSFQEAAWSQASQRSWSRAPLEVRAVIFPRRQVPEIYQLLSLPLCLSRKHSTFSKNTFGVHTK